MQTNVQKEDSVRFWSWVCEVFNGSAWVNIWMIRDANLEVTKLIKQFIWSNAKTSPKSRITEAKFNFSLYEIDLSTINLIDWDATYSIVDWTLVNITWEALWTGWTKDVPIKLANKNWDNSKVTNIVIDAWGTPIDVDVDFSAFIDWEGYTWINPITAQSWVLDADYDYTPNASKVLEYWDADQTLNLQGFRFTNTNTDWKIFRLEILKGFNSEGVAINFQWDEDEDPADMPVSISAFPKADASSTAVNLFKITDEQSVV